jgi:hypothetical protein
MSVLVVLSGEGDRVTLVFEAIGGDKGPRGVLELGQFEGDSGR